MEEVDKENVKKVVYELSKDSSFFANEQQKEKALQERIERMKSQLASYSESDLLKFEQVNKKRIFICKNCLSCCHHPVVQGCKQEDRRNRKQEGYAHHVDARGHGCLLCCSGRKE